MPRRTAPRISSKNLSPKAQAQLARNQAAAKRNQEAAAKRAGKPSGSQALLARLAKQAADKTGVDLRPRTPNAPAGRVTQTAAQNTANRANQQAAQKSNERARMEAAMRAAPTTGKAQQAIRATPGTFNPGARMMSQQEAAQMQQERMAQPGAMITPKQAPVRQLATNQAVKAQKGVPITAKAPMGMAKGGMVKANCGASMKPNRKAKK